MIKKEIQEVLRGYWNLADDEERRNLFLMMVSEMNLKNLRNLTERMESGQCNMTSLNIAKVENGIIESKY